MGSADKCKQLENTSPPGPASPLRVHLEACGLGGRTAHFSFYIIIIIYNYVAIFH